MSEMSLVFLGSLHFARPITGGIAPQGIGCSRELEEMPSRTKARIHCTIPQLSSHMEKKSRMVRKHQENQLKDIQLPKSYTERFALNLESTKDRCSEFMLKVFLLRKQDFRWLSEQRKKCAHGVDSG